MLIGLQLPSVVEQLGDTSLEKAIWYGLAISFVLIISRIVCSMGASVFTRFISRYIRVADPNPGWKLPLIHGWAGMRGVVSFGFCAFYSFGYSRRSGFSESKSNSIYHFYCHFSHFSFSRTYSSLAY